MVVRGKCRTTPVDGQRQLGSLAAASGGAQYKDTECQYRGSGSSYEEGVIPQVQRSLDAAQVDNGVVQVSVVVQVSETSYESLLSLAVELSYDWIETFAR